MWPFKEEEARTRKVNVSKAKVLVRVNDGREFELEFEGQWLGFHPLAGDDWIDDAYSKFTGWQERGQKRGMLWVKDGLYVPLCNVKDVQIKLEPFEIDVPV